MDPIVILGSGLAGYTVAREFRKLDKASPVVLVTRDGGDYYSKPTLSNAFAQKRTAAQLVTTPAADMAAQVGLALKTGTTVAHIDTAARKVITANEVIAYRSLVLALGADPIRLSIEGDAAGEILSVNDLDDYARFREQVQGKSHVAILGGGLIGCEFANDLAGAEFRVTVIDPAARPLASLLPEAGGQSLIMPLAKCGIDWRFGRSAKSLARVGASLRLTLDDGSVAEADLVLSAVGLRPRIGLAREAGIATERGILVDEMARTHSPEIYALGDCAQYPTGVMPYVMPIMHAARALAQTLAGKPTPMNFPPMPVSVKTPAWPVAVQPVPADAEGRWSVLAQNESGLKMVFKEPDGSVRGFVVAGDLIKERMAMTKLLALPAAA